MYEESLPVGIGNVNRFVRQRRRHRRRAGPGGPFDNETPHCRDTPSFGVNAAPLLAPSPPWTAFGARGVGFFAGRTTNADVDATLSVALTMSGGVFAEIELPLVSAQVELT
jgi:hypothetical protein